VMNATQRKQVPWEHSALTKRVYFNPGAQTAPPPPVAPVRLSDAAEAWGATKDTLSIAVLEAYILRYKDTFYAELARVRIDELRKQQTAAVARQDAPPSQPESTGPTWWERLTGGSSSPPRLKTDPAEQVVIATPPALPTPPAAPPARCDGIEAQVSSEK